jgi:hypothetical protein
LRVSPANVVLERAVGVAEEVMVMAHAKGALKEHWQAVGICRERRAFPRNSARPLRSALSIPGG